MDKQTFWPVTFVRIEPNFICCVCAYIYRRSSDFYIYSRVRDSQSIWWSGRLIKLERRVDKRPQCRSNSASPSTLYVPSSTHTNTQRENFVLSFFFLFSLLNAIERTEREKKQENLWMDGCCWERSRGPLMQKKKEEMDLYRVPYSGLGWSSS